MARLLRLEIYRDGANKWRWRAIAGNNKIVGASEQGYRTKWYTKHKAKRQFPEGIVSVRVRDL